MMWEWRNDVQAKAKLWLWQRNFSLINPSPLKNGQFFFISHLDLYIYSNYACHNINNYS